jgi:hypothetical protein
MCYACVDCQKQIERPCRRGAVPKRCTDCKKRRVLERAKETYRLNRLRRAVPEPPACCDCGQPASPYRKRGRNRMRCDDCKKAEDKRRHKKKYDQSKNKFCHTCQQCQKPFLTCRNRQPYCSKECMGLGHRKRLTIKCARDGCETLFEAVACQVRKGRRFCSRECMYSPKRKCKNPACQKMFRPRHKSQRQPWRGKGLYCCRECYQDFRFGCQRPRAACSESAKRAASKSSLATSLRKKCKLLGVPYDRECSRQAVCERDNWVCQICGIKCRQEHAVKPLPDAAEHDHIIALTTPGSPGNVFPNSQCLCRSCNNKKRTRSIGQFRFDFEGSVMRWEKEARARRQRNSRLCEATPASVA